MREKRGLTQRKLAHDLGISQNYIPATEGGARRAGRFADLFETVMVNPETGEERQLVAKD